MRKLLFILLLFLSYSANSQSLSVFDIDTTAFPIMKANFFAFDKSWKQVNSINISDIKVSEDGQSCKILSLSCPEAKTPLRISSVLVMDASSKMTGANFSLAKIFAETWINAMPLGQSNCAVTSFNFVNYINQDFTTNRNKLLSSIGSISCLNLADYNAAFSDPPGGANLIAKKGKYKKIIVFVSAGDPYIFFDEEEIIKEAKDNGIIIHCIGIGGTAHKCMKRFAFETGGQFFDNIRSEQDASTIALRLVNQTLQGTEPCILEWNALDKCDISGKQLKISWELKEYDLNYSKPANAKSDLIFSPESINFTNKEKGKTFDTTITITSKNHDFTI